MFQCLAKSPELRNKFGHGYARLALVLREMLGIGVVAYGTSLTMHVVTVSHSHSLYC